MSWSKKVVEEVDNLVLARQVSQGALALFEHVRSELEHANALLGDVTQAAEAEVVRLQELIRAQESRIREATDSTERHRRVVSKIGDFLDT